MMYPGRVARLRLFGANIPDIDALQSDYDATFADLVRQGGRALRDRGV